MMYHEFSEGWVEVITGPMFSGKSEELIKRIKNLGYANIKTLVIKPSIDDRWESGKIISRSGSSIETKSAESSEDIKKFDINSYKAIAIDEVQFFDNNIINIIRDYAKQGIRVIVSGLDTDYLGNPFGPMPQILAIAEIVDKQKAVCFVCGRAASMTFRANKKTQAIISVGDSGYEARCRKCHCKGINKK